MHRYLLSAAALLAATALSAAELRLEPTFHACSVYWDGGEETAPALEYRPAGAAAWLRAAPMVKSPNYPVWRTSLLQLRENSAYDVRLLRTGKPAAARSFRTAADAVPVARTVKLGPGPARITGRGRPDGWIRYVVPPAGLDGGNDAEAAITVENAAWIIIEGARITGGARHAVSVVNSADVRLINCDISGWGRLGKQDFRRRGLNYDRNKQSINYDAGVNILGSAGVVIERCYIHDPRGTATPWMFAHPAGPCAVYVKATGRTVVRYNDLIGSDRHRWNDVIEGNGNGAADGGFARDADIYGNLMLLGNDDSIELDGGQMNVRVWGNQFEGSLCGVSTAASVRGPSYIWNNLFVRPGDENGVVGSAFKNNYAFCGQGQINIFHNTIVHKDGLSPFGKGDQPRRYLTSLNNVYDCTRSFAAGSLLAEGNRFDYDQIWLNDPKLRAVQQQRLTETHQEPHGLIAQPRFAAPEKGDFRLLADSPGTRLATPIEGLGRFAPAVGISGELPFRPTPLRLDRSHIDFGTAPAPVTVTAELTSGPARKFTIRQNTACDWLEVTPAAGVLTPGRPVRLEVKWKRQTPGYRYKGAFMVRLDDGFSRPVTVYAGALAAVKITPSTPGCVALLEAENAETGHPFKMLSDTAASGGKALVLPATPGKRFDPAQTAVYRFRVPADGWYYPAICFRPNGHEGLGSVYFRFDDGKVGMSLMRHSSGWCWAGMTDRTDKTKKGWFEPVKLSAGEHRLTIGAREPLLVDALAILSTPEPARPLR